MALNEEQFSELEKRLVSFKAQFGVTHTSNKTITDEKYGKSYNVYPDDILTEASTIPFDINAAGAAEADDFVKPSRIRTWVPSDDSSITDIREKITRGHFETVISEDQETNPYVEKIIIPLTRVAQTTGKFYVTFGKENITSEEYGPSGFNFSETSNDSKGSYNRIPFAKLPVSQSEILTNFINPAKFGGSYNAQIFSSDISPASESANFYTPNINIPFEASGFASRYEGWVFDYKNGTLLVGSDGLFANPGLTTENNDPGDDVTQNYAHPLWLHAYRYIGPTGYSHPSSSITASNVQIDNTLNVDGAITFQGLNFLNASTIETSGSSIFGDEVGVDTHTFTGSVFITGGLFVDGESTAGAGGGQSGINSFVFPNLLNPSSPIPDEYKNSTIEPTDQHDVVEYTSSFGLEISGSVQSGSVITKLGSASVAHISKSLRGTANLADVINSNPLLNSSPIPKNNTALLNTIFGSGSANGFLFNYNNVDGRDYPELSSYAPFLIPKYGVSTHSFSFPEEVYIGRIGVYYSQHNIGDPLEGTSFTSFGENALGYDGNEDGIQDQNKGICTIQLSGSKNGSEWFPIFETSSIREQNALLKNQYKVGLNSHPETPETNYSPGQNEPNVYNLSFNTPIEIAQYSSSVITPQNEEGIPQKYKYYKLHVSGGLEYPLDTNYIVHYLHHIQLWENKNQGINNRKRLTIAFDEKQDPGKVEGFTKFDTRISESVQKLGITQTPSSEDAFMFTGTAQANGNFNNFNVVGINELEVDDRISTNFLNVSTSIKFPQFSPESTFINHNTITSNNITAADKLQSNTFTLNKGPLFMLNTEDQAPTSLVSRSIVLDSLNPIYFTNRTQNGDFGVDDFSGRIFGHYTSKGASDLYIDAFRIFSIADQEIRLDTLGTNTTASINADLIKLSGSVEVNTISSSGAIYASAYYLNDDPFVGGSGGGSGFPHNQSATENTPTASITGSLEIGSGTETDDNAVTNPHIILNPIADDNLDVYTKNLETSNILHNYGGTLYWGDDALSSGDATSTVIDNGELASEFDIKTFNIIGGGNINILGTGSFGHLNAVINEQPSHSIDQDNQTHNVVSLVYDKTTNQIHFTGSYGAGGTGGEDDDWTVSDLENLIVTPYVLSERNVKVTGSVDTSTTYKIGTEDVLSVSNGSNLKLASPKFSSLQVEFDQPVLTVSKSGKVGIFNTTPTEGLVVEGNISSSGTIFAKKLSPKSTKNIVTYNKDDGQFHITSSTAFSGDSNTVTDIVEETSLNVSPTNVPFLGIKNIKVQQDNGNTSTSTGEFTTHVSSTSASLIDGSENGIGYFKIYNIPNGTTNGTNIIFEFKKPVIVSEFRQKFHDETTDELIAGSRHLPKEVKIYGKNSAFSGGEEEGTLLAQGARVSFTPISDQDPNSDGTVIPIPMAVKSQQRTSSIAETSLTSSFQYYRIRYSGSFEDIKGDPTSIIINEITPVTRSFTQGTTISFGNGVIDSPQVITNNLTGTASYALYSEISDYANNGFPFNGSAVISGSLSVNGNTNFQNLLLNGNLNMNNYSINNVLNLETNNITTENIDTSTVNSIITNTNILNVGTLPSQSTPTDSGINTTGPITITSIIPGNVTESYDGLYSPIGFGLRIHKAGADYSSEIDGLALTSSNFAFTSGSSASIIDANLKTGIIVNQNTLGSTVTFNTTSYPDYGIEDGDYEGLIDKFQTESFYVKYRFPEPVLIEEFRIDFPFTEGTVIGYEYDETPLILQGSRVFDNDDGNDNILKHLGNVNTSGFFSDDLRILVDDPGSDFEFEEGEVNNLSATIPYHKAISYGMDTSAPSNNDIIIGYDFGAGNETIISKYTLYLYKNHNTSLFLFEGSNDGINYTTLDVAGQDVEGALGDYISSDAIDVYNGGSFVNPIHTRDQNDFQNTTAFRYYRFKFLDYEEPYNFTLFKFDFYQATETTEGTEANFNPEYVSIYSSDGVGNQFYLGSGIFKSTTAVNSTDTKITASIANFNSNNGHPLSKWYTIEFSGSHNSNNLVGLNEIQPVTRSFATQSLTLGPDIEYPNLPEGHPQGVDCSNANAVYYNESTGTFYYTSSCGGTSTNTSNTFDEVITNTITSPTTGIIFDSPSVFKHKVNVEKDLIVRGRILGEFGHDLSLGDPHKPIKDIHMDRGTIFFYSGSTVDSSSVEQARLTVNSTTKEIEFKSGSELTSLRAKEINLGLDTSGIQGPVQISSNADGNQGFIAVSAKPGGVGSTILRAENALFSGSEEGMGSLTQKGSGSFALLLDADQVRGNAKFVIESNTAAATYGSRLFSVSESGETRAYNHFKADTYISTMNVTASNNISASAEGTFGSIQISTNESNTNRIHFGTPTGNNGFHQLL